MSSSDPLKDGHAAFEERRWGDALRLLAQADAAGALTDPADRERLATVAYLVGQEEVWTRAWAEAHEQYCQRGDVSGAARCAFWLTFGFMNNGEMARAGGWLAKAHRLIVEPDVDCAERGWLMIPDAIERCFSDPRSSHADFVAAADIGERFGNKDLIGVARMGQGRALIRMGEPAKAMLLLDELLVGLEAGELTPIMTGDVYCGAIEGCQEALDVRRSQEWTASMTRWMEAQPSLVLFRGQCLVYRASVMHLQGAWPAALQEAAWACKRLSEPSTHPALGAAYYQAAETQRVRGEFAEAEASYRRADEHGRDPQPGLALLRLAQGQTEVAVASIRRVLQEGPDIVISATMLPAAVEILLAAGDRDGARAASQELSSIAEQSHSPFLRATAQQAAGSTALADGNCPAALRALRAAHASWRELDVPYEAARTRALIGRACGELGDTDSAALELEAARNIFETLGAAPDVQRLREADKPLGAESTILTTRELDILRLVATGKTNRGIADDLVLSEKTVARHVSNILGKLGLPSRAAATAYAYEHDLL